MDQSAASWTRIFWGLFVMQLNGEKCRRCIVVFRIDRSMSHSQLARCVDSDLGSDAMTWPTASSF